jgi:uncharacterized OsmC-like protein
MVPTLKIAPGKINWGIGMPLHEIDVAVKRVMAALQRRPEFGIHANPNAVAQWESGTRVVTSSPDGTKVVTDMPKEIGGTGDQVSPGWLFRAGLASCSATSITLAAASEGIALTALQVRTESRSDVRGLLGMSAPNGAPVYAGLFDIELHVTIAADGATPESLSSLVESCLAHSPIPCSVTKATPFKLHVNVAPA